MPAKKLLKKSKKRARDEAEVPEDAEVVPAADTEPEQQQTKAVVSDSIWAKAGLHPLVVNGMDELGFKSLTAVQKETLPLALKNKNLVVAAQTGSGKTLAFGLPVIHNILQQLPRDKKTRLMQCLIIAPTRELALQICEHIKRAAKYTGLLVTSVVGGISEEKQLKRLSKRPHIVCCTPGRLMALVNEERSEFLSRSLSLQLRYLVLDEADRLLDPHHYKDLQELFTRLTVVAKEEAFAAEVAVPTPNSTTEKLQTEFANLEEFLAHEKAKAEAPSHALTPAPAKQHEPRVAKNQGKYRQIIITSATLTLDPKYKESRTRNATSATDMPATPQEALQRLVRTLGAAANSFHVVDVNPSHKMADTMVEMKVDCLEAHKDAMTYYFLSTHPGRTIIFVNLIGTLRRLVTLLKLLKFEAYGIHSQQQQKQRLQSLDRFRAKQNVVLVATDVAARGIDIVGVNNVLHYQFPRNTEVYTHRSGRTARANQIGLSVSLVAPNERTVYKQVMFSLGYTTGIKDLEVDVKLLKAMKERVTVASQLATMQDKDSQKKNTATWYKRQADLCDLPVDWEDLGLSDPDKSSDNERAFSRKKNKQNKPSQSAEQARLTARLNQLLSQPLGNESYTRGSRKRRLFKASGSNAKRQRR
eukprot:TRINITY_DN68247_c0_g1_i1.p1 TRINITY_DN68247_c0_g1~~TRINITY_DN68247_c0_g1_i1.p1  ORF type:complete len:652 (+),score=124.53 TRINITY_DN68247_c0_g1_i1:29-1957(+)